MKKLFITILITAMVGLVSHCSYAQQNTNDSIRNALFHKQYNCRQVCCRC